MIIEPSVAQFHQLCNGFYSHLDDSEIEIKLVQDYSALRTEIKESVNHLLVGEHDRSNLWTDHHCDEPNDYHYIALVKNKFVLIKQWNTPDLLKHFTYSLWKVTCFITD